MVRVFWYKYGAELANCVGDRRKLIKGEVVFRYPPLMDAGGRKLASRIIT